MDVCKLNRLQTAQPPLMKKNISCIFIDRVAGEIIRLVASVCVRLTVDALLFELFDP